VQQICRKATGTHAQGTAGSLIVILLWVYYAALILFFGAEMTQTYARFYGKEGEPEEHAQRIPEAQKQEREPQAVSR
jgi:membrane protein